MVYKGIEKTINRPDKAEFSIIFIIHEENGVGTERLSS
jgi:hypothetical protein